ncbi:hypothetical protein VDGD_21192 [Verticillium dahliae]|nr:hypothetical protein VDGD_21192 [Verticillium dahliae]
MQSAKMAPGAEKPVLTAEEKSAKTAKSSTRYPFWFGGSASSMAACVTHPLDLVKVCDNTIYPSIMTTTFPMTSPRSP